MKTAHTFKLSDQHKINDFLEQNRFLPGTINFNAGTFWRSPSVTFILDHNGREDRERNALEDNLHQWRVKLDEARVNKVYWLEQQIKESKNPNKEVQKTISENLRQANFNIEMNQSQIHAIETLIDELKSNS